METRTLADRFPAARFPKSCDVLAQCDEIAADCGADAQAVRLRLAHMVEACEWAGESGRDVLDVLLARLRAEA